MPEPPSDSAAPEPPVVVVDTSEERMSEPEPLEPTGEILATGTPPDGRGWVRRHRWWAVGTVGVLLAAGAGIGIWLGTGSGTEKPGVRVVTQVVSVTSGTMKQTVSASGTIEPANELNLDFAVSGTVSAVDVTAGQAVSAGSELATVGATALQAQEAADQAALTAAEAQLTSDESSGASTRQIASDEASVTSTKAKLTTAAKEVADATLTSPIAGTVASVNLTVGQRVSGSAGSGSTSASAGATSGHGAATSGAAASGSGSSSAQVVVISTGTFIVNSSVDDTEVAEVAKGDQAVITPTGSTTPIYGTVASVGVVASGSSTVASFPVVIDVTGSPSGVYAGATAAVSIVVKQLNEVVEVPAAAITYQNGLTTVTLVGAGGHHRSVAVTTGITANGETQVTKGLRVGERVVERVVTFSTPGGSSGSVGRFGGKGGLPGAGGRFNGPGGIGGAGGGGLGGIGGAGSGGLGGIGTGSRGG